MWDVWFTCMLGQGGGALHWTCIEMASSCVHCVLDERGMGGNELEKSCIINLKKQCGAGDRLSLIDR